VPNSGKGDTHEGIGIGKEDLPQLQNYPAESRGESDLYGSETQAAPGLNLMALCSML
jgi:hypothetical protein